MDVKSNSIQTLAKSAVQAEKNSSQKGDAVSSKQKLARSLTSTVANVPKPEVEVQINKRNVSEATALRSHANSVINAVNVAERATSEIDKLVKSVDGIVSQVGKQELPESRVSILAGEAKDLVAEIKKQAKVEVKPQLAGNPSDERFKIKKELEESLQTLFTEGAENAFGIEGASFDQKENIINVRASVVVARERVEELRSKLSEAKEQIQSSVVELEVALENSESSSSSLRNVDQALQLATETKSVISQQPDQAVAVSTLSPSALELLR